MLVHIILLYLFHVCRWLQRSRQVFGHARYLYQPTVSHTAPRPIHTLYGGTLQVSEEVRAAVANNDPVVAFESTIITHGMPAPQNIQ